MPYETYHLFFEILAVPIRIRIISLLKDRGSLNVNQICEALGEEQSKVSHNLKRLMLCNLVTVKQEKNFRYYKLNKSTMLPMLKLIDRHVAANCKVCKLLKYKNDRTGSERHNTPIQAL